MTSVYACGRDTGTDLEKQKSSGLRDKENVYKNIVLPDMSEQCEVLVYSTQESEDSIKVVEELNEYLNCIQGPWLKQDGHTLHNLRTLLLKKTDVLNCTTIPAYLPEITVGAHQDTQIYNSFRVLPGCRQQRSMEYGPAVEPGSSCAQRTQWQMLKTLASDVIYPLHID
ncbi:hypothetical protein LEMLEM_LOCUS3787 [Lemmus lemmus]